MFGVMEGHMAIVKYTVYRKDFDFFQAKRHTCKQTEHAQTSVVRSCAIFYLLTLKVTNQGECTQTETSHS